MPQPRLDWTEAAFQLSFKLISEMVLYVGVPTMGGIVGNGKPYTILSMAVGMVIHFLVHPQRRCWRRLCIDGPGWYG